MKKAMKIGLIWYGNTFLWIPFEERNLSMVLGHRTPNVQRPSLQINIPLITFYSYLTAQHDHYPINN